MNRMQDKSPVLESCDFLSINDIRDEDSRRLLNKLIIEWFKYIGENGCEQIPERQREGSELAYSADSADRQKRVCMKRFSRWKRYLGVVYSVGERE